MIHVEECSKYIMYYMKTLVEVRIFATTDGYINVSADHPSFYLNYTLSNDGSDEAYVWLNSISVGLYADSVKALDVITRILNEGKIVEESSCK